MIDYLEKRNKEMLDTYAGKEQPEWVKGWFRANHDALTEAQRLYYESKNAKKAEDNDLKEDALSTSPAKEFLDILKQLESNYQYADRLDLHTDARAIFTAVYKQ